MFTPAEYRESELLCYLAYAKHEPPIMKNMPRLNAVLDTTLDFNRAVWTTIPGQPETRLQMRHLDHPGITGEETMNTAAWQILAPRGKQLLLESAQVLAAANFLFKLKQSRDSS